MPSQGGAVKPCSFLLFLGAGRLSEKRATHGLPGLKPRANPIFLCFNSVGKPGLAGEACSRRLETCGWNLGTLYFQGWS